MSLFWKRLREDAHKTNWAALAVIVVAIVLMNIIVANCRRNSVVRMQVGEHKWDKLLLVLEQVESNYVDTVNSDSLVERLLPGLLQSLDPHSVYLPPQQLQSAEEELVGNFSGIGIQFNMPADTAIVISVVNGGPSERVGLLSGDRIVKVDESVVAGVNFNQDSLVKLLRGERGSKVKVTIARMGVAEPLLFEITRDRIPVNSIDAAFIYKPGLAYIKLDKFSRTTYMEFLAAVSKLLAEGMQEMVLDLRDNSGGYLDQALLLSNEFLERGKLVTYLEGVHRPRQDFRADGRGSLQDTKLYVLVNEASASSSEIFAGAMQDNDRALIFGRRSFGKGLVQEPIYFTDNSGLRLTVARYYTPTGRCIQKPYSKDYVYDIFERYQHGEMTSADSIKRNDSLKFTTPGGKVVYGGGGIIPDIFVPLDTVGVTKFLISVNRKSLQVKFSNLIADRYRERLNSVTTIEELNALYDSIDLAAEFLKYARANGVTEPQAEWQISKEIIINQIEGLVGRYTKLDDEAFYTYVLRSDNVMQRVLQCREEQQSN